MDPDDASNIYVFDLDDPTHCACFNIGKQFTSQCFLPMLTDMLTNSYLCNSLEHPAGFTQGSLHVLPSYCAKVALFLQTGYISMVMSALVMPSFSNDSFPLVSASTPPTKRGEVVSHAL